MSIISVSVLALVTNLCGPTNENMCHNNLMRCFEIKKKEELTYADQLAKRSSGGYPEENLVLECAMDQGIDFSVVNVDEPKQENAVDVTPLKDNTTPLEQPETAPMPDKYGMVWEDELPGKMGI